MWKKSYKIVAVHWQAVVKSILSRVWETGDIYKAKYEGDRPPQLFPQSSELCHRSPFWLVHQGQQLQHTPMPRFYAVA